MRVRERMCSGALTIALLAIATSAAHAQPAESQPLSISVPFSGLSAELEEAQADLDKATARALDLEREIEDLEADNRALAERLAVTAERVRVQRTEVEGAEIRLADARARYEARLVEVYKRGALDSITLLLSSDTIADLMTRATVLSRIAEDDGRMVADLNVAATDARYQETQLDELLEQDRQLQDEQEQRLARLEAALSEQEALVAQLTEEARIALLEARRLNAETRNQWRAASIPIGTEIPRATATVEPHAGVSFIISAYMPRTYRTTDESWTAVCSWYGPGFNGRNTSSGQVFNEDDFTCASRTLPFGTLLALTRGDRRIIVYVNDRGPFVAGRDLDLSKAAAYALGFSGVSSVRAEIILPVDE